MSTSCTSTPYKVLTQRVKGVCRVANLADHPPGVKRAGHCTLQQHIGALEVAVQEPQGVEVLHPLRDVGQAQQAADLHEGPKSRYERLPAL